LLITISGLPGSGTTTVSRLVADALTLERVPGGEVFRQLAAEAGMSLAEFGTYAQSHPVALREGTTPEQAASDNRARSDLEHDRYRAVYGIDLADRSTYDLVLDSTTADPDDLAGAIVATARTRFA